MIFLNYFPNELFIRSFLQQKNTISYSHENNFLLQNKLVLDISLRINGWTRTYTLFYKQLYFPSQPGVAKEISGNEAESCLAVAYVWAVICMKSKKMAIFKDLSLGICLAVVYFLAKFQAEAKKNVVRHDQDPTKTYTRTNSHTLTHSHTLTNTITHTHIHTHINTYTRNSWG